MSGARASTVEHMTGIDDLGRPLYQRIADDIRLKIESGDLAGGSRLESESELGTRWGASRVTVRQAMEVLRADGLVVKQHGRGTFVRQQPAVETRWSTRYQRKPAGETSPFARDAKREGARPDWTYETDRVRSDEAIADRLGIEPGEHVMRTRYLFRANDKPVQRSTSWEPFALVSGTPIEEPEGEGRTVGVVARMDTIGVHIDHVTEKVRSRPAEGDERRELEIPDGVWVMAVERTHWAGNRAVETADIVIPADRYVLAYVIPVP